MKLIEYLKKKPGLILITVAVVFVCAGIIVYSGVKKSHNIYKVKRGNFEAFISCKGEIQSEKLKLINFPEALGDRMLDIYQLQIRDLVAEGTLVKKGDYVAQLDQTMIKQYIQTTTDALQRVTASFNDAKLDSAVNLSAARDELEQLTFDLGYKKVDVEQAAYDSPANQRKAQIAYDRTARLLDAKRRNYKMYQNQLRIRCSRMERYFNETKERFEKYQNALSSTTITAPDDGMIVYVRKWGNRKTRMGDYVSFHDPSIATLPDLTSLVSETNVEEIYISKLHVGDSVRVYVDALKNKEVPAYISNISNIGQDLPGFDANVFKVYVRLRGDISKLKPSMTTNNEIIIEKDERVLTIPLPCLFSENGKQFVYLKESGKILKRDVITGERNDKVVVVKSGLNENDRILMSRPEGEKN
jgi:RND family efflux transporter MFP subunit